MQQPQQQYLQPRRQQWQQQKQQQQPQLLMQHDASICHLNSLEHRRRVGTLTVLHKVQVQHILTSQSFFRGEVNAIREQQCLIFSLRFQEPLSEVSEGLQVCCRIHFHRRCGHQQDVHTAGEVCCQCLDTAPSALTLTVFRDEGAYIESDSVVSNSVIMP